MRWLRASKQNVAAACLCLCLLLATSTRPFSLLFSLLHKKGTLQVLATRLNTQRTQAALDYLALRPKRSVEELQVLSQSAVNSSFRFTIAIITVGRKKPANSPRDAGYVLQSVTSVLSLVEREPAFRDSFVFVCNVDQYPNSHADAVVLKDFLPYVERYGTSTIPNISNQVIPGTDQLYRDKRPHNFYTRETHDYMFCLQATQRYRSQYYLILQDDAVPHADFSDVLEHNLAKLSKPHACLFHNSSSMLSSFLPPYSSCLSEQPPYSSHPKLLTSRRISPSPNSSFAYIKFYFPERWQGFAFEILRLLDLCSLAVVGGGLGVFFHAVWTYRRQQSYQSCRRAFLIGIGLSLVICFVAGRQNLNELRRVSKYLYRFQPSPRCCVPAMLYPAPVMPFLVTWLAKSPAGSLVDLRIADCFNHYEVPGYYIEPNIVHHIGMVSTLPKTNKKPVEEFLLFW